MSPGASDQSPEKPPSESPATTDASAPDKAPRQPGHDEERTTEPADHLPFIEQVLNQSHGATGDVNSARVDLEALKQVALRHRGRELTADPIGVELVSAILDLRFPRLAQTTAQRAEMAEQIASVIFDAEELQDRLETLWNQLCDAV